MILTDDEDDNHKQTPPPIPADQKDPGGSAGPGEHPPKPTAPRTRRLLL